MAMVHTGAGCRRRDGGTKNADARKKSRYAPFAVRVYIRTAVCDNSNEKKKRKKEEKHQRKKEIDRPVAAARMTINLHRITMHVSIKNRLMAKRRYYIWVFRVPIRIIPRIRAMHARKHAARVRPAWLYLIFESEMETDWHPPRNKNGHGSVVHAAFNCESWMPVTCVRWKCGTSDFFPFVILIALDLRSMTASLLDLNFS